MSTHIATIFSRVHEHDDEYGFREGGFYELRVEIDISKAVHSGDAPGFIKKELGKYLAGCVASTGIPLGEGMWNVEFTIFAQTLFKLPEGFTV